MVVADIRRSADADAFVNALGAQVGAPRPGRHDDMDFQVVGAQTHAFGAIETHGADIGAVQLILDQRLALRPVDVVFVKRHRHIHDMRGTEQAVGVFLHPENRGTLAGMVSPDAFKHPQTVMQGVRQHVDFCFPPLKPLAILPNKAVSVVHRHCLFSTYSND